MLTKLKVKGIRPIHDHVLVTDLYFGEQKTQSGLIIRNDDGTTRGIYPRWARVYAKGLENNDEYDVGDYILIEHGRWTRKIDLEIDGEDITVHRVDVDAILAVSNEKPNDLQIGYEPEKVPDGIKAEDFGAR